MLNLALERPFCAKSPTQTWLNTSNKSNQKSHASSCCIISIYFSCRSYQLWGSASDLFPHACHECEAAKPGETAEGKRAGHGTKHVLHVGALTPQFRQMAGINNSMDIGYQRLTPLDVKGHVLLCLCPAFGLPNFSADLHSQNTLDMLRSFRNQDLDKMHLKLNLTFVALQTCSILFLLLNHCLSQPSSCKRYRFEELTELSN